MARGDHIKVQRFGYTHHGIDCGDGTVIHYSGELGNKMDAAVRQSPLSEFAKGGTVEVVEYGDDTHNSEAVVARAKSRLGEASYNLAFNNCEHFARWCKCGDASSAQVRRATTTVATPTAGGAATAAGIGVVSAGGSIAGLSGPGIMSGLATAGTVVGGGAVAGMAALGAAPALMTNAALSYVYRDDPHAPAEQRVACKAARAAGVVGSAAGTAGAITVVSAAGSVTGLSAAGITSGLATIGGVVGGGMTAGTAIVVAAPAVAAVAVAYGAYRVCQWLAC